MMNETATSIFDDSEWNKLMPPPSKALSNAKDNIKFLKKLVAVAASNIVFLRGQLEEESFVQRNLGGLQLRVLQKSKNASSSANMVIQMVTDGMAALDKGYLRKMSLVIFDGEEDANSGDMRRAYETYSFYFGSQDKEFSLSKLTKEKGDMPLIDQELVPEQLTEEYIMRTVKRFLRRLVNGTQTLDVLPDICFFTTCLEYYDDKTPADYEPRGYEHSEHVPRVMSEAEDETFMGMGQVELMNFKMALRLRSKAETLSPDNELHPTSLSNGTQSQENEPTDVSQEDTSPEKEECAEIELQSKPSSSKKNMEQKRKRLEQETQEIEMQYNKKFKKSMKK